MNYLLKIATPAIEALDCVQQRRGEDADQHRLVLQVGKSGLVTIEEIPRDACQPDVALSVGIRYGCDPDRVLRDVINPKSDLGKLIHDELESDYPDENRLSYEVDDVFAQQDYAQDEWTYVTPDEWFEGADVPVESDTTLDEIRKIVEEISDFGLLHGYNHFKQALIDEDLFVEFLWAYRENLD